MRLKKVTITGFKSFKDRTQIIFDGPILCVVGPNGCGKSNLVDAFRWVLGEQSSQIRGAQADDVLFHGVEGVPAVNKAEVSLHFDGCKNSLGLDSDEIEITRRLTREKDSEYLINRQTCRLKEIHQLLSQTGLGRSSAIIEQGKLDQLIYLAPLERGKIFMQASGVDHVLQRKKEIDGKLQEIQVNYDRVLDALELKKKDVQHLQKQAKIATHFQAVKKQIEEIENALCYLEFQNSQATKNQVKISLEEVENSLEKTEKELLEKRNLREKKEKMALELERDQESLQEVLWKKIAEIKVLEERSQHLEQDQKNTLLTHEKKNAQKKQMQQQLEKQEKEKNVFHEKLILLTQSKKDSTALLQERQKRLVQLEQEHQALEKIKEQMHHQLLELLEQKRVISLRHSESRLHLDAQTKQFLKIQESIESDQNEKESKEKLQSEKLLICQELNQEDQMYHKQMITYEEQKIALSHELKPLQKQLNTLQEEIQQLTIQKATLTQLLESQEGFSRGAKFFLQESKKKDSCIYQKVFRLFDLLSFEEGSEQLSMTALYHYSDTIVVQTKEETELLLAIAKEQKIDSFSFICLENLNTNGSVESITPLFSKGNIGQKLVRKLTLEEEFLSSFFKNTGSFVTKDGFFVDEARVVFFVAKNCIQNTSPIRKKELTKVENTLNKCLIQEKNAVTSIEKLEFQIQDLQKQIEQLQTKRHKVQMSHVGENMHLQTAKKALQEIIVRMEHQTNLKLQLSSTIEGAREFVVQIAEEEKILEKKIEKQRDEQLLKNLEEKKKELRLLQNDFFEKQKQDHIISQQEKEVKNNLGRLEEKVADLSILINKLDEELKLFSPKNEELLKEKKSIEEFLTVLKREITLKEEKKMLLSHERKQTSYEIQKLIEQLEKQMIVLVQLEQKKKEFLAHLIHLEEKTKETLEEMDSPWLQEKPEFLKDKIIQLKLELKDEIKINFASIDELKEKQKEFTQIEHQLEDIQLAKSDLETAMTLLDQESQERFNEYFSQVKKEFKKNFSLLFGGGKADLRLRTTSDLFSSGVEILAEPPGKKMQRLTLFSGGEKSLTALALLFSFFAVRPGPFCLLDEVDAPLDEANVHRLTSLLKEHGKNTQFVVITHNKKTMESASLLLGVSMEQKGISRLLSVSFEKDYILSEHGVEK